MRVAAEAQNDSTENATGLTQDVPRQQTRDVRRRFNISLEMDAMTKMPKPIVHYVREYKLGALSVSGGFQQRATDGSCR